MQSFIILLAVEVLGLGLIWLILSARLRRALELDSFVEAVRREVRGLETELNEAADRDISLVEDRLEALRSLLEEADRRILTHRRELGNRQAETEIYDRLGLGRPRSGAGRRDAPAGEARLSGPRAGASPVDGMSRTPRAAAGNSLGEAAAARGGAAELPLFPGEPADGTTAPDAANVAAEPPRAGSGMAPEEKPAGAARPEATAEGGPIRLDLARRLPEAARSRESVIPPRPLRERALELHDRGFSAEVIAARLGATVAEVELLVSMEEGRRAGG